MADHKEYWSTGKRSRLLSVSLRDVVASIAALSASETKGVSGFVFQPDGATLYGFISKRICPRASVSNSATMIPLR